MCLLWFILCRRLTEGEETWIICNLSVFWKKKQMHSVIHFQFSTALLPDCIYLVGGSLKSSFNKLSNIRSWHIPAKMKLLPQHTVVLLPTFIWIRMALHAPFLSCFWLVNKSGMGFCLIYPLTCKQRPASFAWTCLAEQEAMNPWNNTQRESTWRFARMCCATATFCSFWFFYRNYKRRQDVKTFGLHCYLLEAVQRCSGHTVNFKLLWKKLWAVGICAQHKDLPLDAEYL